MGSREQVSIASESQVQDVIEFLSRRFPSSESPYREYDDFDRHGEGKFSYPPRYPPREYSGYGVGGRGERQPQSDNSSSGSSGIDDPYSRGEQYMPDALRSGSTSAASYHSDHRNPSEGEMGHSQGEGGVERVDGSSTKPHLGSKASLASIDSGIHLHGGGKMTERERTHHGSDLPDTRTEWELSEKRKSQELPFDFGKGFGPLISSDPHQGFGMLHNTEFPSLDLYKNAGMSDSDSDHSSGLSG